MKSRNASVVVKRAVGLILTGVMIGSIIPPAKAQTPRLTLHKIIEIGDKAAGFREGSRIRSIEDVPRMDRDGNASFALSVTDLVGEIQTGIFRHVSGETKLAFKTGDFAPGTNFALFTGFPNVFPQTPRIDSGRLTFPANISGDNALAGIWSDFFGDFSLQVLQNNRLPGMPIDGQLFDLTFTTNRNHIFLNGEWSTPTQSNPADEGLWRNSNGQWQTILIRGMQAPGFDQGVVFDADPLNVFGPLFTFRTRSNGKVLVQVWVKGPRITDENNEALMVETDQGLTTLVREGQRVSGPGRTTFGPSTSLQTFGSDNENLVPAISDNGKVVFGSILRSNQGKLHSVWTNRNGSLQLLTTGSLPLVGYDQGDQAPGFAPGVLFATFITSTINDQGVIAFLGGADEFGDVNALTLGLWWDRPGAITLVAARGKPAPVVANATLTQLDMLELTESGNLYFIGRFAGPGIDETNNFALFRAGGSGTDIVLREGDVVDVVDASGNTSTRVVRALGLGPRVTPTGQGVLSVLFTDGTGGIYRAQVL
jgi:hypothetical protein